MDQPGERVSPRNFYENYGCGRGAESWVKMTKKRSILIVEDKGLIALHLQEILQTSGYSVPDPVASGEDAIEYL